MRFLCFCHQGYWPLNVLFLCPCVILVSGKAGFVKWVCKCSFLFCLLEEFEKQYILWMFSWIHQWSCLILDAVCWEVFLTDSVSLLVIGLLRFLFLHNSVLVGFMFLGIYPFHLYCPICHHINCSSWSLIILCIAVVLVVMSPLSFLIFIWVLFFKIVFNNAFYLIIYLIIPHGMQDLSSLARYWAHAPCSGSTES